MPRLAVIGHPVAHSRSPAMQNAALAALGLAEEWRYEAIEAAPEVFEQKVRAMAGEGFAGANVTVPHKEAALGIADVSSEMAKEIGAANTLVFADEGIGAHNTDAPGLIAALPEPPRAGMRALVLGAGGAARAAVWALKTAGARVDLWNRTTSRAEKVRLDLGADGVLEIEGGEGTGASVAGDTYDLIVNTTAVGLQGEDPFEHLPLAAGSFRSEQVVVDMVYAATPSALLTVAQAAGASTVDGIEVLVRQGALSLQIWTGREAPVEAMRTAAYGSR